MEYIAIKPLGTYQISPDQARKARTILAWTQADLACASGVSVPAIEKFEAETTPLREVSLQALTHCFEAQGLIFIPGQEPLVADNVRGCTPDPRTRHDYAFIE